MYQWSTRYFILSGSSLTYKIKMEDPELKGRFDLCPGCIVTDIEEDYTYGFQGKKLFSFWVVWPQDRNLKETASLDLSPNHQLDTSGNFSGEESEHHASPMKAKKDLKHIVATEAKIQREAKEKGEEQRSLHVVHDKHVGMGFKVAAAVVGGAVVGATTAGVGLIPYAVILGTAAAAVR